MKRLTVCIAVAAVLAWNSAASAQEEETRTGDDLLQLYKDGGMSRSNAIMYTVGVLDILDLIERVCLPDGTLDDFAETVIHTIGTEQYMREELMSAATFMAAVKAFPCEE